MGVCHTHVWAEGAECRSLKPCQFYVALLRTKFGSHHILLSAMLSRFVKVKKYSYVGAGLEKYCRRIPKVGS